MRDHAAMASGAELAVTAPFDGVVVAIPGGTDERVGAGSPLVVLEAMKMEH
jgi:acetyl/propionyl-CoA carboxylase alpha subunit